MDTAYISFADSESQATHGFTYACDPSQVDGQINLDFDVHGRLRGIEVLEASKKLPMHLLKYALKTATT